MHALAVFRPEGGRRCSISPLGNMVVIANASDACGAGHMQKLIESGWKGNKELGMLLP
jgi:hypothetical protein